MPEMYLNISGGRVKGVKCGDKKKQTHTKSNQICGYQKQGVEGGGVMQRWSECTNSQSEPDKN